MFEQSQQEQQQPCVTCNQQNQQMLMLSCAHDPCVNCAATHYVENQPRNSNTFTCGKCGQETELDRSSILELQKVYSHLKGRRKSEIGRPVGSSSYSNSSKGAYEQESRYPRTKPYETIKDSRKNQRTQYDYSPHNPKHAPQPVSQPSYSSNPKKAQYQLQYPCPDHAEQQLTYFCFSCNRPICPQCAIHGMHKDHEVQTTRKAIKQIRSLLHQDKQKLQQEINNLIGTKDRGKKQNRQWAEQSRKDQQYIKKKLTHLRNILIEKQKELTKSAQGNFQRNCDILKQQSVSSDKSLQEIAQVKRNIDSTLKKQQLVILQQFNKRDDEVNDVLDRTERERSKFYDFGMKNPNKILDLNLFDEEVDRILGDIHALKLATIVSKQ